MPETRQRVNLIPTSIAGLGALSLLLARDPKPVQLTKQWVEIDAEADQVFGVLTALDERPRIVERSAHQIIAEFPIHVGWYRLTTLERITLIQTADRSNSSNCEVRSSAFRLRAKWLTCGENQAEAPR